MAVTVYKNQGAVDPLVGVTIITYKGRKNPLPQAVTSNTIVPSGLSVTLAMKSYWRNTGVVTNPYPIMQPGATTPIGFGVHMIPVKPLPGGGGGSSGVTIGYGI